MSTLLHWVAAFAAAIALGACAADESYTTPALQDAQRQAADRARWERGARDECRATYGPDALMFETAEGHLVCRRAGPSV